MGQISFHTLSERHYSVVFVIHMKSTSADEDVLTVAWPDGWRMALSPQQSPAVPRRAPRPAQGVPRPWTQSSSASGRPPEPRWGARRRSWPTLPSKRGAETGEKHKRADVFGARPSNQKEPLHLSFEQTGVKPVPFKWTGPRFILSLLTSLTKRETSVKTLTFHNSLSKCRFFECYRTEWRWGRCWWRRCRGSPARSSAHSRWWGGRRGRRRTQRWCRSSIWGPCRKVSSSSFILKGDVKNAAGICSLVHVFLLLLPLGVATPVSWVSCCCFCVFVRRWRSQRVHGFTWWQRRMKPSPPLPCHVPVDEGGVQPVKRQGEAHHRHDDRDGRDKVAQRRRGDRLDPDEVCTVVDMSIQDAASSKVALGGGRRVAPVMELLWLDFHPFTNWPQTAWKRYNRVNKHWLT